LSNDEDPGNRRDFLYVATAATGAVTAGAAIWPLVNQMNPSADVQALSSIEVDVGDIEPGTQITVKWLGKPVFIRRRTQEEIEAARSVEISELTLVTLVAGSAPVTVRTTTPLVVSGRALPR